MEYNARIEYQTRSDVDEELLDSLVDYHPATSRSARGWVEVTITLPADSLRQALTTALSVASAALSTPVLTLEVLPTDEFDARQGLSPMPQLVSVTEAAALLKVTRQAVLQRLESGSLAGTKVGKTWAVQRDQPAIFRAGIDESDAANLAAIPEIQAQRNQLG